MWAGIQETAGVTSIRISYITIKLLEARMNINNPIRQSFLKQPVITATYRLQFKILVVKDITFRKRYLVTNIRHLSDNFINVSCCIYCEYVAQSKSNIILHYLM